MSEQPKYPIAFHHRPLHVAMVCTAILAFPLVWMGGLVTSKGAGMSVPDWPNSYGYNMFALPFGLWLGRFAGGAFYEHSHRLLGTLVGLSAFTATMLAWGPSRHHRWRRIWGGTTLAASLCFAASLGISRWLRATGRIDEETYKYSTNGFGLLSVIAVAAAIAWACRRRDVLASRRWHVAGILMAVCIQGAVGGFRVDQISLTLAKVHGIFGQLVFAGAAAVAVTTSRWWLRPSLVPSPENAVRGTTLRRFAIAAVCLVTMQLTLGALMRHDPHRTAATGGGGAGLAIPDWPLQYGHLLPPMSDVGLADANADRVWKLNLPPTTLDAIWLHFAHRLGAYTTATVLLALAAYAWLRHRDNRALLWPATALGLLVFVQVTLGVQTVLQRKPADIATAHQATGALLLMTSAVLLTRVIRLYPLAVRRRVESSVRPAAVLASPAST